MRLPTRLDRYPAKMVSRLADDLISRYALNATSVLDPFCGSGAVLTAAADAGIDVAGMDINPVGVLLTQTKLNGFDLDVALQAADRVIDRAKALAVPAPIEWDSKAYWFTPKTIDKFERLRASILESSAALGPNERTAILLSLALSVRLCSKADQRSPKPFISVKAKEERASRHFDPYIFLRNLLRELGELYRRPKQGVLAKVMMADIVRTKPLRSQRGKHSHVITSPPYINAQDYFRNFKLELHVLEGLVEFQVSNIKDRFVGTDRGELTAGVSAEETQTFRDLIRGMKSLERRNPRLADVVYRYLKDMETVFDRIEHWLQPNGTLVLVCGDNLVGGLRIRTWQVLQQLLEERGFLLVDTFRDQIRDRLLAPKRCGHKGLIKEEVVCCYERA